MHHGVAYTRLAEAVLMGLFIIQRDGIKGKT